MLSSQALGNGPPKRRESDPVGFIDASAVPVLEVGVGDEAGAVEGQAKDVHGLGDDADGVALHGGDDLDLVELDVVVLADDGVTVGVQGWSVAGEGTAALL